MLSSLFRQTRRDQQCLLEDDNGKESKEPDYDEEKDQLEEKQEEETGKQETTNRIF